MSALYTSPNLFKDAAILEYGLRPELLGVIYGSASIVGAGIGLFMGRLRSSSLGRYILLDGALLVLSLVGYSLGSVPIAAATSVVVFSFWRFRGILYEDYLLNKYKTKFKATMISGLRNIENLQRIWLPGLLGLVLSTGYERGFLVIGIISSVAMIPFYIITRKILS